jgi:hypothetical protein
VDAWLPALEGAPPGDGRRQKQQQQQQRQREGQVIGACQLRLLCTTFFFFFGSFAAG